jgi:cell division protein FtsL
VRRRAARAPRGGVLVTGGVVWIVVIAMLLAGVVAVNVSVLRLNLQLSDLERQRAALQAENASLSSQVSSTAALSRIQRLARAAGLVPAPPGQTTYLSIRQKRK